MATKHNLKAYIIPTIVKGVMPSASDGELIGEAETDNVYKSQQKYHKVFEQFEAARKTFKAKAAGVVGGYVEIGLLFLVDDGAPSDGGTFMSNLTKFQVPKVGGIEAVREGCNKVK